MFHGHVEFGDVVDSLVISLAINNKLSIFGTCSVSVILLERKTNLYCNFGLLGMN